MKKRWTKSSAKSIRYQFTQGFGGEGRVVAGRSAEIDLDIKFGPGLGRVGTSLVWRWVL